MAGLPFERLGMMGRSIVRLLIVVVLMGKVYYGNENGRWVCQFKLNLSMMANTGRCRPKLKPPGCAPFFCFLALLCFFFFCSPSLLMTPSNHQAMTIFSVRFQFFKLVQVLNHYSGKMTRITLIHPSPRHQSTGIRHQTCNAVIKVESRPFADHVRRYPGQKTMYLHHV